MSIPIPATVKNIRIRSVDNSTILIFWSDVDYPAYERCIRSYEIYYSPIEASPKTITERELQWQLITSNKHIPFLSYYHQISTPNQQLEGKKFFFT